MLVLWDRWLRATVQMSECVFMQVSLSVYKLNRLCGDSRIDKTNYMKFTSFCKWSGSASTKKGTWFCNALRNFLVFVFRYIATCDSTRKYCCFFVFFFRDGANKKANWTPEEEEELQRLYEEHKDSGGETPFIFMLILQTCILRSRYTFKRLGWLWVELSVHLHTRQLRLYM